MNLFFLMLVTGADIPVSDFPSKNRLTGVNNRFCVKIKIRIYYSPLARLDILGYSNIRQCSA